MHYTIIGAEANLASRLQSIAEPGQIIISYETYVAVREIVTARELPSLQMKGISYPVVPYAVEGLVGSGKHMPITEHTAGFDFYLDPSVLSKETADRTRQILEQAIAVLGKQNK